MPGDGLRFGLLAFLALTVLALTGLGGSCARDPVYEAVRSGDADAVERLLAAGADANTVVEVTQPGHSGATFRLTPLMVAAQHGDVAMIERLVAAGADPHWDDGSFTAFEWAIRAGNPEAARRLWELSDGVTYASRGGVHIPLAMRMGDDATFDFVLQTVGVDGCEAASALMPLARNGSRRSEGDIAHVRRLLDLGVHPTAEALHCSVHQARREMTTLLLDRGDEVGWLTDCFVRFPDFDPLALSLRMSLTLLEIDMVKMLLERGADPNVRYASGRTPLMVLTREVHRRGAPEAAGATRTAGPTYHDLWFRPLFDLLVAHGADLALRDDEGRTAADLVREDDPERDLKRALLTPTPAARAP